MLVQNLLDIEKRFLNWHENHPVAARVFFTIPVATILGFSTMEVIARTIILYVH